MNPADRRYDIDWLRVIAIFLLLIYHIGIGFQPWGVFIGFIQNSQALDALWIPMSMLNIWRIPLLFFVSGMGVSFALRRRNIKSLIVERSRRILIPYIFGIVAIAPIHLIIWQLYYRQDLSYILSQSHLWFLGNIFSYVIIIVPLLIFLKSKPDNRLSSVISRMYSNPVSLLVVTLTFVLEALIIQPGVYETYSLTMHGYIIGFLAFFFGFTFIYAGKSFWSTVSKWKLLYLLSAISLFLLRYYVFDLQAPGYLKAIESNMWIFAAFGFANTYLNRPSAILIYLNKAVYPVYILHMIFIYLASFLFMPTDMSPVSKLFLVILVTFAGSFGTYEYIVKRIKPLRILFGLK